jgi:hypothetical protein
MLFKGDTTGPARGPRTPSAPLAIELQQQIESDNTLDLDDVWASVPCSIIVTPSGQWFARPDEDDEYVLAQQASYRNDEENWLRLKRSIFFEHHGTKAVAWDVSWHFIGTPTVVTNDRRSMPRPWLASAPSSSTSSQAWATRIREAIRLSAAARALVHAEAA